SPSLFSSISFLGMIPRNRLVLSEDSGNEEISSYMHVFARFSYERKGTMLERLRPQARLALTVALLGVSLLAVFLQSHTTYAASSVTINGATTYQTIDGFGFSEAFGQASTLESATSSQQQQILNDLFSTSTGAGFTILRNILPSDSNHTIEPNSPGSPSAAPTYTWDGNSWGQVALSKQAMSYGVNQIYG